MLAGVAVLANLGKDLLHDNKLVRDKREVHGKFRGAAVALDVQNGIRKAEQVTQDGIVLLVEPFQLSLGFRLFLQNALLNDLIHGRGGEGEAGLETRLNPGEFIRTDLDDLIDGFLAGTHHPDLAAAFAADLLSQGLEVQQHIRVGADVLAHLVDHEQEPEIPRLGGNIGFDVLHQPGNGKLHSGLIVEPPLGVLLAHIQHFHERRDDELPVEGECLALVQPALALFRLKHAPEFFGLAKLVNILLQHGNLQILAVEAEVGIEHLGKDAQHRGLVLVDGAFNIDVEEDGFRLAPCGPVDQHEGRRIILKLFAEHLNGGNAVDISVLQYVRQHFQEVRFTTSKEAGDPDADIVGGLLKSLAIVIKETDEMLLQLFGDDIFPYFLLDDISGILIDLDNAVYRSVDVLGKHLTNQHGLSSCFAYFVIR